jgi:hypothetical protein
MKAHPYHLIVWIDHQIAHLYSVTRDSISDPFTVHAPDQGGGHIHHKAGTPGPGHVAVSPEFLKEVAQALGTAQEILIVGPANAKTALKKYIDLQMPLLKSRVTGVEPMEHASKAEVYAFAVPFFRLRDLMAPVKD